MKKSLPSGIILCMIFLCTNTFGQTTEKPRFDLLLNLVSTNLNYGNANSTLKDYKKSVLGAQVGVSFQAGIAPKFSLVSELYFIMKGGELKTNNPLTSYKTTLRLYTMELPVLARFHIGDFYTNAGPSIAYNMNGTRKVNDLSTHTSFNNSIEGFKHWDAGVQIGAGYNFHFKRKIVGVDIRYSYGLTNISYGQEMYNRYLNIGIHFSKAR